MQNLIGDVYDCAANPEKWPETLNRLRDMAGCAYVMAGFIDASSCDSHGNPMMRFKWRHSTWDPKWFAGMEGMLQEIPHFDRLMRGGIDQPWTQMSQMNEAEFQRTGFYQNWVRPQGLRDCLNLLFVDRRQVRGVLTMTTREGRPLVGKHECEIATQISPHIRRAMAINDLVDKANLALTLYRRVLDSLSCAVFIVAGDARVVYSNAMADALLSSGDLLRAAGAGLEATRRDITGTGLDDAISRAVRGDTAIGIAGIGVPLASLSGERAAAYVLPIRGSDLRADLGPGYAAIFIARRDEQQPVAVEILRTLFDLTAMEAKVAYAVALGDAPEQVALALGNSVNTVRTHLKSIYDKVDVPGKTALAARIHTLVPPIGT
ncbi:MAG: hypothetical protein RLZZ200_1197 [Pseudomonadota bacterium]|jgi:DNA-binding CsgD family transcriptional regulator